MPTLIVRVRGKRADETEFIKTPNETPSITITHRCNAEYVTMLTGDTPDEAELQVTELSVSDRAPQMRHYCPVCNIDITLSLIDFVTAD